MKNIFFFLALGASLATNAQQLNTSSFYELYPVLHNPAATGSRQQALVGASFKKQWSGVPGSPQPGVIYGQAFLSSARLGLGGYLYHDVTGPTSRTGLQMAYAYHVPTGENRSLSFGLEVRLQQLGFDRAKLQAALGALDPVAVNLSNQLKGDVGVGLAYTSPSLLVGASVSQLVHSRYQLYEAYGLPTAQSRLHRHFYVHGAYTWLADEDTKIIPNALVIYLPNAPLEMQTGARVVHHDLLWYGLSWRAKQGWMLSAGMKLKKKFSIGYSFDIYQSPLSIYEGGSAGHELLLQYQWR